MKRKIIHKSAALLLCGALAAASFTGCGVSAGACADSDLIMEITEDEVPLGAAAAAVGTSLMPQASGTVTKGNSEVIFDISNTSDGYIMVKYLKKTDKKLKLIVKGPSGTGYTYDITVQEDFETFPLSDGNGCYTVTVYKNISGTSYSTIYSASFDVQLKDQFAPFLLPNQYVNYTESSETVKKAGALTEGKQTDLEKIEAIYSWVVKNITYDKQLAASVKSGYLPDPDRVLSTGKGICFDYASLMTAMLRSLGIPCKLVVGYSGTAYHAWINAYTNEGGWIDSVIYFDGTSWKLMDPTYAATGRSSDAVMEYIGDGSNYQAKYLY